MFYNLLKYLIFLQERFWLLSWVLLFTWFANERVNEVETARPRKFLPSSYFELNVIIITQNKLI